MYVGGRRHGAKTLYLQTHPGLNMDKLEEVDTLARRIASYATNTPTPFNAAHATAGDADASASVSVASPRELHSVRADPICADGWESQHGCAPLRRRERARSRR